MTDCQHDAASANGCSPLGMLDLLATLAPNEGSTQSRLDSVKFVRANRSIARTPIMYEPSIVFICQGRKRAYVGERVYTYDPNQYLVLSVPLPLECETQASEDAPMFAVCVRVDIDVLVDLLELLDTRYGRPSAAPTSIFATALSDEMSDAVTRLLKSLCSAVDAEVLGPSIVREICYRVLTGEQGNVLRAALVRRSDFGQIAHALRRIHVNFSSNLSVGMLADEAHMSVAGFHAKFKAVTATSPLQYLKTTRLQKARLLMLHNGIGAAAASAEVGYESPSQFSRDFKRLFGRTPIKEVEHANSHAALLPSESTSVYVTS
ncbi:AraC family transcriptional regulator [Paraburkholderia aromaticivorans]|uniref:AraC family transcriptional regulator n=1 Tax=Paraburkholderia aromaticivorans TaxID=2026199 RepID=UPI001455E2DB|nr:AraC family transcriptional regulator [Paraburkholderia aromaticivorans]